MFDHKDAVIKEQFKLFGCKSVQVCICIKILFFLPAEFPEWCFYGIRMVTLGFNQGPSGALMVPAGDGGGSLC